MLVPVRVLFSPESPATTTTITSMAVHEGTDGERGQCSAGESGLLSLSEQGGEGTLHSGSGAAAAAGAEEEEREWDMETEGGGGDGEEEKEMSRRRL